MVAVLAVPAGARGHAPRHRHRRGVRAARGRRRLGNILTDGRRFYLTDFGQAVSTRFHLSEEEQAFCHRHLTFDRTYTLTFLVN